MIKNAIRARFGNLSHISNGCSRKLPIIIILKNSFINAGFVGYCNSKINVQYSILYTFLLGFLVLTLQKICIKYYDTPRILSVFIFFGLFNSKKEKSHIIRMLTSKCIFSILSYSSCKLITFRIWC